MVSPTRAREIISRIEYVTLSTTSIGGEPWNSPVYAAFDDRYTFYWGSDRNAQHSQNIRANGRGFLVIYDSTVPAGAGEGVYIRAACSEITSESQKRRVHALIQSRRAPVPYWKLSQVIDQTPIQLYQAVPQAIWMNDEGSRDGHYVDTRTEIDLSLLQG